MEAEIDVRVGNISALSSERLNVPRLAVERISQAAYSGRNLAKLTASVIRHLGWYAPEENKTELAEGHQGLL